MGSDQKVVKRSDTDEPRWVVIHMCMEAMLGISLYRDLYLKLAKTLCLYYYLLCFLFNKIGQQEGRTGSAWKKGRVGGRDREEEGIGAGERSGPNNVYTYK
jgi:hypothetical protein